LTYHSEGSYFEDEDIEKVYELLKRTFENENIAYSIDYVKGSVLQLYVDYMEALRNHDEVFIEHTCDSRLRGCFLKNNESLYPNWY